MINKAVGYSGFRTYGELPYATRKQGKQLELANKVWQSTARQVDKVNPLENFNPSKTVYKQSHIQNTNPIDYHPDHVKKGASKTLDFSSSGKVKAFDKQQAAKFGKTNPITDPNNPKYDERKSNFLKTGTEHWKTVYQQTNQISNRNKSMNKTVSGSGFMETQKIKEDQNQPNKTSIRGQSQGGKSQQQIDQEIGRAKSYKNRAYINNSKTGITDYKFNYGEKIGTTPLDLMNRVSYRQPLRDHPLKRGTNQLWTEIPNYQGFKPSELSFKEYKQKIERRNQQKKGNLKLETTDNFLLQVPGYGGFRPHFQSTVTNLRESCFSNKPADAK